MQSEKSSSSMKKTIENLHRKAGYDQNLSTAIFEHLKKLNNYMVTGEELRTRKDMCDLLMSKFFLDHLEVFPLKKFKCNVDENSDWPVPIVPAEVFSHEKPPEAFRKLCFFSCLKVGDALDCRVASVLSDEYQLRVIHKYGIARVLDDLNLTVTMKKSRQEQMILEKELLSCELIRVAVSQVDSKNENVLVTVDRESLDILRQLPKLGRISDKELPSYVLDPPDPEKYSSYADYLDSMPEFKNPILMNNIIEGFGLNPRGVYSYYPTIAELDCAKEFSGSYLLKQSQRNEARSIADSAVKEQKKKNYDEALALLDTAIKICPENDPFLSILYDLKGNINLHKGNGTLSYALCVANAYRYDQTNKQVKRKLSKLLFKAANSYYRIRNHKQAAYLAEKALEVEHNEQASALLRCLKTKHPEIFMNLEKESIYQLQVKKKQLVTELQKMDTS